MPIKPFVTSALTRKKPYKPRRLRLSCMVVGVLCASVLADVSVWVPERLVSRAQTEYGARAHQSVKSWRLNMQTLSSLSVGEKIQQVNAFFNRAVPYKSDIEHWGKDDYWATPFESLVTAGGDCEDYVIAKYYTLTQLGVRSEQLRITYVNAIEVRQAHMVLAYYPTPDAIPLVLDNLNPNILPADQRTDLIPVYSFNVDGLWLETQSGAGVRMGTPNKLDSWVDLRLRMREQQLNL